MSLTTATPIATTAAVAASTTTTVTVKPAEKENEALPRRTQQATKSLSLTNGALRRHQHHAGNTLSVSYKECLKNHAASLGGNALDGCGEFMPSPSATPTDPTSLKCAACGCHRNFHRRDPEEDSPIVEYQPPPPPLRGRSPNSASPPPLSSSYYPSAPHMLLALSGGLSGLSNNHPTVKTTTQPATTTTTATMIASRNGRKRFRTKFSPEQKEKMHSFSERLGWKMQKRDEHLVEEFCNEVGVEKGVLKVWMHNNKNTFGKRDVGSSRNSIDTDNHHQNNNSIDHNNEDQNNDVSAQVTTNGSSSSS